MGRARALVETPEDVFSFTGPTPTVIHPPTPNFRLEHFEILDDAGASLGVLVATPHASDSDSRPSSSQRVQLSSDYLRCRCVRSQIRFCVGDDAIPSLRFIERTFDVTLGYCMPNSENEHEVVYELPELSERVAQDLERHAVAIDSFFFAGDDLVPRG
jgi:hypothetical protein